MTVTARVEPSQQQLDRLHTEFTDSALASVSRNVNAVKERLAFAEEAITRGRQLAAAGGRRGRGSRRLCTRRRIGSSAGQFDARCCRQRGQRHPPRRLRATRRHRGHPARHQPGGPAARPGGLDKAAELSSARDAAVKAVAEAQSNGAADPLGAFTT